MKKIIVIFFLLTTACHRYIEHDHALSIEPIFLPFFHTFVNEGAAQDILYHIDDLRIESANISSMNLLGFCQTRFNTTPLIVIDTGFWATLNDSGKEELVFHELGHCILGRNHLDGSYTDSGMVIPKSIMSTWFFDDFTYAQHRAYYIKELFQWRTM